GAELAQHAQVLFAPAAEADEQDVHRRALLLDEIAAEVLGDFVVEHTGFHPAHDEKIGGGDEDAVQHAVLGLSEAARSVAHRYLEHAIAAHLQQRRDEAVEASIEHEPAQALAPERAERTAAVLDHLVADPVAHAVGHARREPAQRGVARAPVHAPPGDRIPAVEVAQQAWDVVRIVLEIRVHRDHEATARRVEADVRGGRLARVDLQSHEPHARIGLAQAPNDLGAAVAAAVVDE